MSEGTEKSFSTGDFSNVDDVISIIDAKKESGEAEKFRSGQDLTDRSTEFGVGRHIDREKDGTETNTDEEKTELSEDKSSEGTQDEQSASSEDKSTDKPEAEESVEAQESQSEDSKEGEKTETDSSMDLKDDEEYVIEMDDGSEVPIEKIVEDWKNNQNWQKTNTEKAQQLADEKREFEAQISAFKKDDIQKALDNDELMEALDDWFEGSDHNPFRDVSFEKTDQAEEQVQESTEPDEKAMLQVDREIFELQKVDDRLNDQKNLDQLLDYAVQNKLELQHAHKLIQWDSLVEDYNNVVNELKERNDELSKMKKMTTESIPDANTKAKGTSKEGFKGTAGTWEGAEDRVLKKLGLIN